MCIVLDIKIFLKNQNQNNVCYQYNKTETLNQRLNVFSNEVVWHSKFNFRWDKLYNKLYTGTHVISFSYHKKGKQEVICQSEEMRAICVPSGKWTTIFTDELTKVIL